MIGSRFGLVIISAALVLACRPSGSSDSLASDSASTSTSTSTTTTTGTTTTGPDDTTSSTGSSSTTGVGTTGPFDPTCEPPATTGADTGTSGPATTGPGFPDGDPCMTNDECQSQKCFIVPVLGGVCGECLTDDDCPDGGCSLPNVLADPPVGASCNLGEPGGGCMTDDACCGTAVCAVIISVPGLFEASTCGQCVTDDDCNGALCNPDYDIANLAGTNLCVLPGTVPNDSGCNQNTSGDEACMSGFCEVASLMGLLNIGVCGECSVDTDCADGETCAPAEVDLMGTLTGTVCVP